MPFTPGLLEVKTSANQGRGLHAKVFIPKGTVYWRVFGEGETIEPLEDGRNSIYTVEELRRLDEAGGNDKLLRSIFHGGYYIGGRVTQLKDGGHWTNGSNDPNGAATMPLDPKDDCCYTLRDVKAGEEITESFSQFAFIHGEEALCELVRRYNPDRYNYEVMVMAMAKKASHGHATEIAHAVPAEGVTVTT